MPNSITQLETISAKDLLTQPIAPLEFTIDTILPHGLFILSGSSKIGKSWLSLVLIDYAKSHRPLSWEDGSLAPSFVLSKQNPLRWASVWYNAAARRW